jgi:TonB family protein
VGRAGALALDAKFSTYGDYAQRFLEAVQSSWWLLLSRSNAQDFSAGTVVIRFRLHPDGTVTDATIVSSSVSTLAALACQDAITLPAPYDAWRPEMLALLGDAEWVTLTFIYR